MYEAPTTLPGATGPMAKDESTKKESYGNGGTGTQGILGTNGTPATGASGNGAYSLDQRDVNYALNHAVETTNHAPGTVKRLSVAVIVDEKAVSQGELPTVQELVSAAAGYQADRGDTVVVNRMPFDTTVADRMKKDLAARAEANSGSSALPLFGAAGAVALLVVVATFLVMRRRKKDLRQLEELAAQLSNRTPAIDLDATGVHPVATPGNDGASMDGRFGSSAPPPLIGVEGRREERQQVLTELIDNQPDEVAQLLRGWLGDRRAVKR
jgi:flagellar M-ring protein FliF